MNKFYSILFVGMMWNNVIHAQLIDSLQKVLPTLKDTARIDCLQKLSIQYLFKRDEDSALYFANLAAEYGNDNGKNFLLIKITDDGVGRKQAATHNSIYATNTNLWD